MREEEEEEKKKQAVHKISVTSDLIQVFIWTNNREPSLGARRCYKVLRRVLRASVGQASPWIQVSGP